jgi:hypothetical protein
MNEDDVVAALRRLGHEHEPDSEAIWARVDPARAGGRDAHDLHDVPVVSLDSRRDRDLRGASQGGVPRRRPRPLVLVPLAAAAVLGVLVVSQTVTRQGDVATSPVVPATSVPAPSTTVPPRPATTGPATSASGDAVGTAVSTAAPTRTSTVAVTVPGDVPVTSGTVPDTGVRTSTAPSGDLGVPSPSIVPLGASARSLLLSTPQYDDWVVVGARGDGRPVRAKRPADPQAPLAVEPPAGAAVVPSPLSVSWGDGLPEQSRSGATTWLAGRGGAWTVTTERLDVPRRLTIVGGGAPSGMRLDVVGPGRRGTWTWSGNPAGAGPFTLSVVIPGGVGPITVTLTPLGGDDLAVSAVSAARI